jgi:peroxygenase
LEKVHRTKHGSDTEVYDTEGRFLPAKFEEIFNKYATTRPDAMTYEEIIRMTDALRNVNDPYGWSAAKLEWGFTYNIGG